MLHKVLHQIIIFIKQILNVTKIMQSQLYSKYKADLQNFKKTLNLKNNLTILIIY